MYYYIYLYFIFLPFKNVKFSLTRKPDFTVDSFKLHFILLCVPSLNLKITEGVGCQTICARLWVFFLCEINFQRKQNYSINEEFFSDSQETNFCCESNLYIWSRVEMQREIESLLHLLLSFWDLFNPKDSIEHLNLYATSSKI